MNCLIIDLQVHRDIALELASADIDDLHLHIFIGDADSEDYKSDVRVEPLDCKSSGTWISCSQLGLAAPSETPFECTDIRNMAPNHL